MSFHKQIEQQLSQEFSPKEATILIDYQDAGFYGRQLQAMEMGRQFAIAWKAVAGLVTKLGNISYRQNIDNLPNYLRQDVGLNLISGSLNGSFSGTSSRGYM